VLRHWVTTRKNGEDDTARTIGTSEKRYRNNKKAALKLYENT
jgi:hypothetical protein